MRPEALRYKESPDAWQTKVQALFRLPFPIPWMLIAGVFFAIGYVVTLYSNDSLGTVRLVAIKSVLIAAIANSVVFYEKLLDSVADTFPALLDEQQERAEQWISQWYTIIFWSKKNLLTGLLLGSVCLLCSLRGDSVVILSTAGRAYSFFMTFIIGFLGGSMFWTMLGIAGLTSSLGKDVQIRPSIFDTKTSVLRTASSVIWKVSLTASLVYLLGVSIYFFALTRLETASMVIVLSFGAFIILYFIFPQVNIHKTLLRIKRTRLKVLVQRIDDTFDKVAAAPSPENINQLRDLFHLQGIVNGKRPWSFGTGELLLLIGSVIIPLLLFMLQHFIRG